MADVTIGSVRGGVVEKLAPGDRFTATVAAGQAATGGKLVELVPGQDRQVRTAQAGSTRVIGVALHDAAAGEKVTVATEGVWMLYADGNVTAGAVVAASSAGDVAVDTVMDTGTTLSLDPRAIVGKALADFANDTLGPVRLGL